MAKDKINLLMITPENREINHYRRKQLNNFMQLTMPYLAGFVDENIYQIELVDEYNQKIPFHKQYDLVAITVNTPNAYHCYAIARRFRESGARTVFGGPHVTLLPDEAGKHCDYVIIGEAEYLWPQFLKDFQEGCPQKIYASDKCPSLNNLPLPRRDLVRKRSYTRGAVFATRGCSYNCSYCNLRQIYHPVFRKRPVDEVIRDIASIKSRYFVFWDDNLFADIEYAKILLKELKKLKKKWAAQVTLVSCRDEELLEIASQSGCLYLFIGLESFLQESLLLANKDINIVSEYQQIISLIHKHRICVQAGIIFGFDADKKDIFAKTLQASEEMGIDGATVSILTPFPRTFVYNQLKKENRLLSDDWADYNGKTRVAFRPKHMTPEELYEGYMWFRRKFYSWGSIYRRLNKSRVRLMYNFLVNLGYKMALKTL